MKNAMVDAAVMLACIGVTLFAIMGAVFALELTK